jgi:hypothetical protein
MFAKTFTALTATAALGALIAVAAPTTSAEAASRHFNKPHRIHAVGKARIHFSGFMATRKARRNAISNWRGKVGSRYGWRFNKWFVAKGKHVNCSTRRFRVKCHVSARPRPVGGFSFYRGRDIQPRVAVRTNYWRRRNAH